MTRRSLSPLPARALPALTLLGLVLAWTLAAPAAPASADARVSVTNELGDPVNLTDFTFQFALVRPGDTAPLVSTEVSPPTVETEATDVEGGLWEARVTAVDSAVLRGTYEYQAQVIDANGLRGNVLAHHSRRGCSESGQHWRGRRCASINE